MKLDTIYRIVSDNVDATMPSEVVMDLAKQVRSEWPDSKDEVIEILEEMEDDVDEPEEDIESETVESEMDDDVDTQGGYSLIDEE